MRNSRNCELTKNTIVLGIGQIIPKLIAIFILPFLTTYLSQQDYGLYELNLSIASFCIPILSVQIQQAAFRFLLDRKRNLNEIITNSFFFLILSFGIASFPIILCWFFYNKNVLLAIFIFFSYFSEVMLNWAGQVTRGLGDNINYSFSYIIYSISYIVLLSVYQSCRHFLTINIVVLVMACSYMISVIFLFCKLKILYCIKWNFLNKRVVCKLLKYSFPMVISSVSLWIVNLSDRFFVTVYLGIEATALYGVAYKIPNLFNSIYNIFNLAWTEHTSKLTTTEKREDYYTLFFERFFHIMVGMMLMLITVTPILFRLLINKKYMDAYEIMSWLYLGVFFSSLSSFLGAIYIGEKRTTDVGTSSVIGAILNVTINLCFMKKMGVIIAAISTIVSFFIIFIYRAIDIRKYVSINYNILSLGFGIILITIFSLLTNRNTPIISLISVIITVLYNFFFNKDLLNKIFRMIVSIVWKGK